MAEDVTMVERVARALTKVAYARVFPYEPQGFRLMYPGGADEYAARNWAPYASEARAAIEAMREPDAAMRLASKRYKRKARVYSGPECYRAMLDAALAPPTPEDGDKP